MHHTHRVVAAVHGCPHAGVGVQSIHVIEHVAVIIDSALNNDLAIEARDREVLPRTGNVAMRVHVFPNHGVTLGQGFALELELTNAYLSRF